MRVRKFLLLAAVPLLLFFSSTVFAAGDFGWIPDFNARAMADLSDFKARIAARFQIGHAQVEAVFSKVGKAADAYMVFRLGEMSNLPTQYVIDRYGSGKKQGWGALAKSLGIKPGSKEFHALKRGDDLYGVSSTGKKGKGKNKDKGKGKQI